MSTLVLGNEVGIRSGTAGDGRHSSTAYVERTVERSIHLRITDEERLYGLMEYNGVRAASLREAAPTRQPLPEAPRPIQ